MDRLRVRRPSRFPPLYYFRSCRRVWADFYIYLYRPVLLNSDNPRRRHRNPPLLPFLLPLLRRYAAIYTFHDFLSLSPSLFSFTFTLSFLVAATKLSAKGGDLRPPLPDSSTSNRLVWNHFSIIVTPPSIVSDIYIYYAARAILRSLSFLSRYILDIIINFGM